MLITIDLGKSSDRFMGKLISYKANKFQFEGDL